MGEGLLGRDAPRGRLRRRVEAALPTPFSFLCGPVIPTSPAPTLPFPLLRAFASPFKPPPLPHPLPPDTNPSPPAPTFCVCASLYTWKHRVATREAAVHSTPVLMPSPAWPSVGEAGRVGCRAPSPV